MSNHLPKVLIALALCMPAATRADEPATAGVGAARPSTEEIRVRLADYYFAAARRGDEAMLREFVAAQYDLDSRTREGYTALILAAYNGQSRAVDLLLTAGADPCAEDRRGNTALMGAIFKGELAIARRLLDAECQPDQRNKAGQTAAMYAALFGRAEILQALLAKGADLDAADAAGNTPRSLARGEIATSAGER